MGLPQAEIPLALLLFNVGVEAGQLFFVALIVALERSSASSRSAGRAGSRRLPGYTVGALGAFWTIQRTWMLFGGAR